MLIHREKNGQETQGPILIQGSESKARSGSKSGLIFPSIDVKDEEVNSMSIQAEMQALTKRPSHPQVKAEQRLQPASYCGTTKEADWTEPTAEGSNENKSKTIHHKEFFRPTNEVGDAAFRLEGTTMHALSRRAKRLVGQQISTDPLANGDWEKYSRGSD
ncbi:hypothetical protein EVAR_32825_1 [Eumeta japonica]|uniref:Uncharacterized protein n=1 Tax=Eumeta variegata TaxID=151549 RepID=A0A4C1WE24_EUMVA|nr:hypothetical protein EVAR_32825_1 [Eumeta japonica]